MRNISFNINSDSPIPKFQQLADEIVDAINNKRFKIGDPLPSVNVIIKQSGLSRDTIVKAYNLLKHKGIIESFPQKGYFVSCNTGKVFLFLDTFKAYKEVLYDTFRKNLSHDYAIDLHFHHYDIDLFDKLINESLGKYSKYIIMNFDHKRVAQIVSKIDASKLLVIDWNVFTPENVSYVVQDFDNSLYAVLDSALKKIKKYDQFTLIYPSYTYHPEESVKAFKRFCKDQDIMHRVDTSAGVIIPKKGELFLSVSDRALARLLDAAEEQGLVIGEDVGVISYNETPMKKYIHQGIAVISTDFEEMGRRAAQFVTTNDAINMVIPTTLIDRKSL